MCVVVIICTVYQLLRMWHWAGLAFGSRKRQELMIKGLYAFNKNSRRIGAGIGDVGTRVFVSLFIWMIGVSTDILTEVVVSEIIGTSFLLGLPTQTMVMILCSKRRYAFLRVLFGIVFFINCVLFVEMIKVWC